MHAFGVIAVVGGPRPYRSLENDNVKADIENVIGTDADDRLYGNDGSNTLAGRGGNDELTGGEGSDILRGGEGDDVLFGSDASPDTLDGGQGDIDSAQADSLDQVIAARMFHTIN